MKTSHQPGVRSIHPGVTQPVEGHVCIVHHKIEVGIYGAANPAIFTKALLVHSMVDFFLLLQLAGAGDELQGIKRGIMEMADALVITKADGNNVKKAEYSRTQFANALTLFPVPESGIRPAVMTCSSIYNNGIAEIWDYISGFIEKTQTSGYFSKHRKNQQQYWFHENIREKLNLIFLHDEKVKHLLPELEKKISAGILSSTAAADILLDAFLKSR